MNTVNTVNAQGLEHIIDISKCLAEFTMSVVTKTYRYQLPAKALKGDCPQCAPKHRKTLSRYIDTRSDEPLPDIYGRCDRESNCGYHLSPYHKDATGSSYANEVYQASRQQLLQPAKPARFNSLMTPKPSIHNMPASTIDPATIPWEVVQKSLSHYDNNQFANHLINHFDTELANKLLAQFQVGSSRCWDNAGACVFWLIDEQNRVRGGQIKLFDETFHTVKYVDREGRKRSRTSWVHSVLAYQYDKAEKPRPDWLTDYIEQGEFAPCLFGLPQLLNAPKDKPVAIVEAPKTAVLCAPYFPQFIWLAVIGRSYLNAERLTPVRNRPIVLFPDLSTDGKDYHYWESKASALRQQGFNVRVSDYLERQANQEQREKGFDLADFLLLTNAWQGRLAGNEESRIQGSVRREEVRVATLLNATPIRLPKSLEAKWQLFGRPPLWWNKIATHKAIQRCLAPDEEPNEPQSVTTIQEQLANPGAVLKPDESQLERLTVEDVTSYPAEWDEPSPPDAVPIIKSMNFHEWQCQNPYFSQMGLASLNTKQS
ncbi:DUF6371 domain-containing protein [Spirosoma panaciterrae]|uniref:DUF6371 domain-containing protein n=1 Tax=Spirosoma panaciterrae TaxID=496058 RepID=UPI00037EFF63|nr:DUF6371 domain-containing protein [Spirosoma panaciterrae]